MTRRGRRWALTIAGLAAALWATWWLYHYTSNGLPQP